MFFATTDRSMLAGPPEPPMSSADAEDAIVLPESEPTTPAAAPEPSPRWEWRSFDYRPQLWQEALRGAAAAGSGALTAETYLLTRQSTSNVKLRDDRVEVKRLLQTDGAGLEQWRPVLKAAFPLAPNVLAELCDHWQRPRPDVCPLLPTSEHLLSFLARQAPDVRVIPLRKWRRAYRLHECTAERATVLVDGGLLETLSLEQADPALLLAALQTLHLDKERNTNYVLALKRLVGW